MAAVCPVQQRAEEFVSSLGLFDGSFDRNHDRCYCRQCYHGADVIGNDGPQPYIIPHGWVRFGLHLPRRARDPSIKFFQTWSAAFHGVKET